MTKGFINFLFLLGFIAVDSLVMSAFYKEFPLIVPITILVVTVQLYLIMMTSMSKSFK